jgi:hypothetical protein
MSAFLLDAGIGRLKMADANACCTRKVAAGREVIQVLD